MILRHFAIQGCVLLVCCGLCCCAKIYTGEQLSAKELERIKKLGLLDDGEKIYQFYSNNKGVEGFAAAAHYQAPGSFTPITKV